MRAGLSTIQQTLTPEAATVLTHSIAEAARRCHGQTTPLHVAATLLYSPSGLLRQACIKSHPNSSHPLQCRALELCFSVALDRLPSNSNPSSNGGASSAGGEANSEPPISNALMAALKRAQAHQRRACPEQQQSPLLAVKVELQQMVVSILDVPSVSRVMKEAGFSSAAVKSAIEQSISANPPPPSSDASPVRNLYMNPRLKLHHHHHQQQKLMQKKEPIGCGGDEAKRVMEILMRSKKRNPVLVGDSDLSSLMRDVIERVERSELGSRVRVISLEKEFGGLEKTQIPEKIRELGAVMNNNKGLEFEGVVIDLGDLKWLVEGNGGGGLMGAKVGDIGKEAAAEMARLIAGGGARVWAVGTATCATYLRCQVYHPAMENEWDLQAVPIAPRAPLPGLFPKLGSNNGILSSTVEALAPSIKSFPSMRPAMIPLKWPPENIPDNPQKQTLCSQCTESYDRELAKLVAKEFEKSSSDSRPEPRSAFPQWLQIATPSPEQLQSKECAHNWNQNTEELLKKWRLSCSRLHSKADTLRSLPLQFPNLLERPVSPPSSPVKTDLVLGRPKLTNTSPIENAHRERIKEFPGCKNDNFSLRKSNNIMSFDDSDSLKRLFKGLIEKVSWQTEAASAVTAAVLQAKSDNGERRGLMPKPDTWLLFIGSDKIGKRKMASALSELVFGIEPVTVCFGESSVSFRGRTALDRVVDSIKKNPFSVIMLEDIDRADSVVHGTIKRAIERGRLPDSYGREVSLGSTIFVLTASWVPDELKCSTNCLIEEEKILSSVSSSWQLEISVNGKRLPDWLSKEKNPTKRMKDSNGLSLDLNLAAGCNREDEGNESSWNSSDLTVEHEHEHGRLAIKHSGSSAASEFIESVDSAVVFKPVDFASIRRRISDSISGKFSSVLGSDRSIRIDDNVLDRIIGGIWLSGVRIEDWSQRVLVPGIEQFVGRLNVDDGTIIRVSAVEGGRGGEWLPSLVRVVGI